MRRRAKWYDIIKPLDPDMPVAPGERQPSVETLWSCAQQMFKRVASYIVMLGGHDALARRYLRRRERWDILEWLEPVERTVRGCLIVRAIAWLTTQSPDRRAPARQSLRSSEPHEAAPSHDTQPGRGPAVQSQADDASPMPAFNASAWLRAAAPACVIADTPDPGAAATDDHGVDADATNAASVSNAPTSAAPHAKPRIPSGQRLARRIALLQRLLENPDDAIQRLGRALARIPRSRLAPMAIGFVYTQVTWMQGIHIVRAARFRAVEALEAFAHIEPG